MDLALVISLLLIRLVVSSPTANFPVNSQVPPVAQLSQYFEFEFSASTFTSSAGSLTYGLSNAPSWLQLNSANRTLYGTPTSSGAVGTPTFQVSARDSDGTTDMSVVLVVVDSSQPQLGAAILPQLANFGATSSPDSLLLYPSEAFAINFSSNTFTGTSSSTNYYATSGNNTPLPSWIQFNDQNLAFSGTTPSLVSALSYPQTYPIRLIASDIVGFASAIALFEIVVGYDILSFNVTYQSVSVAEGEYFQGPALSEYLSLNGDPVNASDIASVTSDAPSWLTLSTGNISLGGTPPSGASTQNVTVTVTDIYGDTANTTMNLDFSGTSLFDGSFSQINATIGQFFIYDISDSISSNKDVSLSASLADTASWLSFNSTNATLFGMVPSSASAGVQRVQITAKSGSASQTETLPINIVRRSTTSSTKSSPTSTQPTSTRTSTSASEISSRASASPSSTTLSTSANGQKKHSGRNLAIVLGILLPVLLLLFLILFLLCCTKRRRRHHDSESLSKKDISRPIPEEPIPAVVTEISSEGEMLEKPRARTPEPAPRLELPWVQDSLRKSRARWSKKSSQNGSPLLGPQWADFLSSRVTQSPPIPRRSSKRSSKRSSRSSKKLAELPQDLTPFLRKNNALNYSRKRAPFRSTQSRNLQDIQPTKRASRALSGISSLSSSLPTRFSGMGHGSGGFGPPGFNQVRQSWQNQRPSMVPSEDSRLGSVDLETFPHPPQDETEARILPESEQGGRTSLRLVQSNSVQRSSISDERQRYLRDRARDRLEPAPRFSSTWSMRPSDSRDSRGIMERIRSPGVSSSVYPDDQDNRDTWRTYSKSSSVNAHQAYQRPETIESEDEFEFDDEPMRPPPLLLRDRISYSSGQFDTADESTDSNWEDEDIEEAVGPDGQRRWQVSASNSPLGSPLERPLDFGEAGLGSRRPSTSRGYPPPLRPGMSERRWRLGDRRGKRAISVTEADMARSQGSQRGNLAFV